MRPYLYTINEHYSEWIDLDSVVAISEPGGVNKMGFGGMYFGFGITFASRDQGISSKSMFFEHKINHVHADKADWYQVGVHSGIWCAQHHPDKYVDQTKQFQDRWQALFDAWVNK